MLTRHCEQREAIQRRDAVLDCFVATLLAMTTLVGLFSAALAQDDPYPAHSVRLIVSALSAAIERFMFSSGSSPRARMRSSETLST